MRICLALALALSVPACGTGAATEAVLRFTAIPDQNTTDLRRKFDPVAAYLGRALGVEVEYVASRDYQAAVNMFKNGEVQLAWFGGLTGVQARHSVKGARVIAQGREDPRFYSYFIAHKDSGLAPSIDFPTAIRSKKFTFGSESSTSGRLMPESFIMKASGKTAMDFFETTPNFSRSHDQTAELVNSGQYDAGVLNYRVFETRRAAGKTENCVVIWKTPEYADYNFTAHPGLEKTFGEGFIEKLQRALVEMKDPELLGAFPRSALIAATNEDFEGIEQVAIKLGMVR